MDGAMVHTKKIKDPASSDITKITKTEITSPWMENKFGMDFSSEEFIY
jgi:hypothetical protein